MSFQSKPSARRPLEIRLEVDDLQQAPRRTKHCERRRPVVGPAETDPAELLLELSGSGLIKSPTARRLRDALAHPSQKVARPLARRLFTATQPGQQVGCADPVASHEHRHQEHHGGTAFHVPPLNPVTARAG